MAGTRMVACRMLELALFLGRAVLLVVRVQQLLHRCAPAGLRLGGHLTGVFLVRLAVLSN